MRRCPRCPDSDLSHGAGAWGEDVCGGCQGRFLEGAISTRLFEEHLRIGREMLFELTREGPRRLVCPGCAQKMTLTMARGVQVDLCGGCGGAWLDSGELSTLTNGMVHEVATDPVVRGDIMAEAATVFGGARSGGLDLARPPAQPTVKVRFVVACTNCDAELDLHEVNWLINQYPWCPRCAAPYTGLSGMLDTLGGSVFGALTGLFSARRRTSILSWGSWRAPSMVSHSVDVLRISPADADVRFASFFRAVW